MSTQERAMQVIESLRHRQFVKVIAGIDNVAWDRVQPVVASAQQSGSSAVDVAADEAIVKQTRAFTTLPVFASSVDAQALANAIIWGADIAEIGNYDALYKTGFYLTAQDVLDLTKATVALLPEGTPVCVTIPGHLSLDAQIALARQLEAMGIFLLQTEGASKVVDVNRTVTVLQGAAKADLTLTNTAHLASAVSIPVMTASGLHHGNVDEAFASGAAGVGIGSAVNKLANASDMVDELTAIMAVVARRTKALAAAV